MKRSRVPIRLRFLAVLSVLALFSAAFSCLQAQNPPAPGDRVRVLMQTATVVGRVASVAADSLVVDTPDPRFTSPLTVDWRMIQRLDVSLGQRKRTGPALIGAAAGAAVMGALLLQTENNRINGITNEWFRPYAFSLPILGAAVGFAFGGERWREAALPAQKAAADAAL